MPRALLWVLILGLAVRIVYIVGAWLVKGESVFYESDTVTYVEPARELLSSGTFGRRGEPELQRTPGYPVFLVPAVLSGHLTLAVLVSNVVLSMCTVLGTYVLARRLFGDSRVAIAAAALYAIEPLSIVSNAMIASETLFTAMAIWALVLIVDHVRFKRTRDLVSGTVLLAIAAYVRPAGYYLPFGLIALLGAVAIARRAWNQLLPLGLAAALAVAVVLPWHLRNRALGYNGFSAAAGTIMYFANAAAVKAAGAGVPFVEMQTAMGNLDNERYFGLHPEQRAWRPGDRFTYMKEQGTAIVRENLALYARIHVAGMARVAFDPGAIALLRPYGLYPKAGGLLNRMVTYGLANAIAYLFRTNLLTTLVLLVLGALLLAEYLLGLCAVLARRRFLDVSVLIVVASIAYFIVIAGGPIGYGRFRHPAMPLVCALAAAGLFVVIGRWRRAVAEEPASPAPATA